MTRFLGTASLAIAGLAIVVLAADLAEAQPGGGGRGRGGRGRGGANAVTLAANAEVQTLIAVSDAQKTQITEISEKLQSDQAAIREAAADGPPDAAEIAKVTADAEAKIAAVLDASQNSKVLSILAQVLSGPSLNNSLMAKHLKITDAQKTKLTEVAAANRGGGGGGGGGGGRGGMTDEERAALEKQYTDVLTTEQQAEFAKLKAVQPVDEELMGQLRRGGGRGGRGGRGGGQ